MSEIFNIEDQRREKLINFNRSLKEQLLSRFGNKTK